ncbi:MAG: DUF3307 domain-containing protein [Pseudomonadota bacterium]
MSNFLNATLPLADLLSLYLLFRLKHFMADYVLQTSWMARGKEQPDGWLTALFAHSGVHALGTAAIAAAFAPSMIFLGTVDLFLHASIDRAKTYCGRYTPSQPVFWWIHGVDQEAHHLCHFAYVLAIVLA